LLRAKSLGGVDLTTLCGTSARNFFTVPGMETKKARYRRPTEDEQQVLEGLRVELVRPEEMAQCKALLEKEHYLHSAQVVGEHLSYVAVWKGQWLAIAAWSAAVYHLQARDQFIGWSEEQRRERLPLVANNARLLVLESCHYPNLVSRFMKLMLGRLPADWQVAWGHPVVLAETFVDPYYFQGTAYKVSGWSCLGGTKGWKRSAVDFYQAHGRPKQVWVRELEKQACVGLRAGQLPAGWTLPPVPPRCTAKTAEIRSLIEHLHAEVPEFRRAQGLGYPVAGMLALIAMAVFSGVRRGPEDLAAYAATLSQNQLRALRFRYAPGTRRVRCPETTTIKRVLAGVDAQAVERVLLLWQEQVLGPVQNGLVIIDGKEIRHADVKLVNAVSEHGRWLGSTFIPATTNEIPVAREQLAKLDLTGKIVLADAMHCQTQTARQILFEKGGDYLFTVKANQKELVKTLERLLTEQPFSPSTHAADPRLDTGTQSRPT
jgi:Druantia protein DruA/DDE_Tnp_1-associated/Transposase DDE domain